MGTVLVNKLKCKSISLVFRKSKEKPLFKLFNFDVSLFFTRAPDGMGRKNRPMGSTI